MGSDVGSLPMWVNCTSFLLLLMSHDRSLPVLLTLSNSQFLVPLISLLPFFFYDPTDLSLTLGLIFSSLFCFLKVKAELTGLTLSFSRTGIFVL